MVARRLRPGVLEDLGLPSALNSLATDFREASGIPITPGLDPQLPSLTDAQELVLYRIAQEGLTNIARHSAATGVALDLRAEPDRLVLTITDDGQGLRDAPEGAGIRGMRERAILIGADLALDTGPDGGTVLRLIVPIPAKGRAQ